MYGANLDSIPAGVDGWAALEEVRRELDAIIEQPDEEADGSLPQLSDHTLVRFLVVQGWDTSKALEMLKAHVRWLREKRMAEMLASPFEGESHINRYYPQVYHGVTRAGRPICIERLGALDMPRLLEGVSAGRVVDYISLGAELQVQRRLPACTVARGEVVDRSLNILDLAGLTFGFVTNGTARAVLKEIVATMSGHYPEITGATVIINAPTVFNLAWTFIRPFISQRVLERIFIFGSNRKEYMPVLLEFAEADQLPAIIGGTCVCDGEDPQSCMLCCSKGPWADPMILQLLEQHTPGHFMSPDGAAAGTRMLQAERQVAAKAGKAVGTAWPTVAVRAAPTGVEAAPREPPLRQRGGLLGLARLLAPCAGLCSARRAPKPADRREEQEPQQQPAEQEVEPEVAPLVRAVPDCSIEASTTSVAAPPGTAAEVVSMTSDDGSFAAGVAACRAYLDEWAASLAQAAKASPGNSLSPVLAPAPVAPMGPAVREQQPPEQQQPEAAAALIDSLWAACTEKPLALWNDAMRELQLQRVDEAAALQQAATPPAVPADEPTEAALQEQLLRSPSGSPTESEVQTSQMMTLKAIYMF